MLGRHPAEVRLSPRQIAELAALRALRNPDICPHCMRLALMAHLERTCDQCGSKYEDPDTKTALSNMQ